MDSYKLRLLKGSGGDKSGSTVESETRMVSDLQSGPPYGSAKTEPTRKDVEVSTSRLVSVHRRSFRGKGQTWTHVIVHPT